jgi:serine/threonine-protein kinase
VLYELLARARAFGGEDVSDTLAEILKREPDWSCVPKSIPSAVRRLLRRCLERDPRRRLRDMGDVAIELEDGALEREGAGEQLEPDHDVWNASRAWQRS